MDKRLERDRERQMTALCWKPLMLVWMRYCLPFHGSQQILKPTARTHNPYMQPVSSQEQNLVNVMHGSVNPRSQVLSGFGFREELNPKPN